MSEDWSVIEGEPRRIKIKGKIRAKYDPEVSHVPPLEDWYTVTLYPKKVYSQKGRVFFMKFKTKEELESQAFNVDETVIVEGILRCIDGKQIVTNVKRSSEEF